MKLWRAVFATAWLIAASQAQAANTFVAAGTASHLATSGGAATTTPGLPAGHTTNDALLVCDGYKTTSGTVAESGYTDLLNTVASAARLTLFGKIDGGSESTASITAAGGAANDLHSSVEIAIRGAQTSIGSLIGASASRNNGNVDQTIETPALTVTDANSLIVLCVRWSDDLGGGSHTLSTPTGFTKVGEYDSTTGNDQTIAVYYQIQTTATDIAADTITVTGGSRTSPSQAIIVSVKVAGSAPAISITDVDTDESITYSQTNVVVTGTGFGATQGAGFMRLIDGAITSNFSIDSWANTSIQGDTAQGNVRFGSRTLRVQENGGTNDDQTVTVAVPSGEWYVDITTPVTLNFNALGTVVGRYRMQPNRYYDFPTDLAAGDQLHCKRTGGSGNLTLNPNGTFTADSTVTQIQCRIWHTTWGSYQTWDISGAAPIFVGPNP